jgi:hypothetical protein
MVKKRGLRKKVAFITCLDLWDDVRIPAYGCFAERK